TFFGGDFIRLDKKGGWFRGQQKEPIPVTQSWVINIHEAQHGWIKCAKSGGEGVKHEIVLIRECPVFPLCHEGGGHANDHNDKACDWRAVVYLPMRSLDDPDDVVCYSGTGMGARRAVGDLFKAYRRPGADRQGKNFVVLLESFT